MLDSKSSNLIFAAARELIADGLLAAPASRMPCASLARCRAGRPRRGGGAAARACRRSPCRAASGTAGLARRARPAAGTARRGCRRRTRACSRDDGGDLAWKRLDGPRWWARLADSLTMGMEASGSASSSSAARNASIDGRSPLLSVELIELMLRIPTELSFGAAMEQAAAAPRRSRASCPMR